MGEDVWSLGSIEGLDHILDWGFQTVVIGSKGPLMKIGATVPGRPIPEYLAGVSMSRMQRKAPRVTVAAVTVDFPALHKPVKKNRYLTWCWDK